MSTNSNMVVKLTQILPRLHKYFFYTKRLFKKFVGSRDYWILSSLIRISRNKNIQLYLWHIIKNQRHLLINIETKINKKMTEKIFSNLATILGNLWPLFEKNVYNYRKRTIALWTHCSRQFYPQFLPKFSALIKMGFLMTEILF